MRSVGRSRLVAGALLAIALACAALTAAELYRSGIAWGPLRKPAVYLLAGIAASSGGAWMALRRRQAARVTLFVAFAFVVFLANDRRLNSGDTAPATLVPYALVRNGTLALDGVVPSPLPPWVVRSRGRVWSQYPVTTALLAVPVYLPAALGPGSPGFAQGEKLAAAALAALSVGFLLATLLRLGVGTGAALLVATAYAFGSPVLTTASQALWQHTGGVLALSAALYCAVRSRDEPRLEPWSGFCAGLAFAARPTNAFAAALLLWATSRRGWRSATRCAAGAAIPVALVALYDTVAFGAPWRTGYAGQEAGFGADLAGGLAGVLVSPTRGLLTYVPWALLALPGLAIGARRDRLHGAALLGVASIVVVHAWWNDWPGGWGYGPRLLTDAAPLLAIGLAPLLAVPHRRWALAPLAVMVAVAVWLAWLGTFRAVVPPAREVYLGAGIHAAEWWRYPPLHVLSGR